MPRCRRLLLASLAAGGVIACLHGSESLGGLTFAAPPLRAERAASCQALATGVQSSRSACSKRCAAGAQSNQPPGRDRGYKVWIYIFLWYVFSIAYNITFKKALNAFPFPWTCAMWQMSFGIFIFGPLWLLGIRQAPKLSRSESMIILPSALGNLTLHVGAVIAFFGGAVSFVHVVKASEPVVSSLLNYLFVGEVLALPVYAALVPIIAGVALASFSELSFTWLAFGAAMLSNFGSAGRAVYAKKVMAGAKVGENMDAANTFSVMTLMGSVLLLPLWLYFEPPSVAFQGLRAALMGPGGKDFVINMLGSGIFYYLYNETAFKALGKLDAVSHAVVNTMKRVAIIIVAIIVFSTPVTKLGAIGSGIAVVGTLLYSLAKARYPK